MSRWFRFHEEVLNDPKVQLLDPVTFKGWVNLLCIASKNDGVIGNVTETAFALRMSENDAQTLLERLSNAGLIDRRNGGANGWHYVPHGWEKRQFKSDSSADRVSRYRNKKSTVTVTPPETDTETDTEVEKNICSNSIEREPGRTRQKAILSRFNEFWAAYPRKVGKGKARKAFLTAERKSSPDTVIQAARIFAARCVGKDPEFIPHPASWLNAERWLDGELAAGEPTSAIDTEPIGRFVEEGSDEWHALKAKGMRMFAHDMRIGGKMRRGWMLRKELAA